MITYDNQFVLQTLVAWINDITRSKIKKRFHYVGNNINSNLGEPSKSYIQGQFFIDRETNTLYIYYILDPNTIWGKKNDDAKELYKEINSYIQSVAKKSLLNDLHIEFIFSEQSIQDIHELLSNCRTEETNRCIYDDIQYLWKSIDGRYMFIRDRGRLIDDKHRVYKETDKSNFNDYIDEIMEINTRYSFLYDNNSLVDGFNEYKVIYNNYFGREPYIVDENEITRFYLINYTDFSIKE